MIIRYEKNHFSTGARFCSNPGTEEVDEFVIDYPSKGGVRLKKVGTIPLYKQIQANKANCDLASVLETCIHENQLAVCSSDDITSAIADFSGMTSMAEIYSGMKHVEEVWKKTPLEVRELFNGSKTNFVASIGDDDFMSKIDSGFTNYYGNISKRLDSNSKPIINTVPEVTPEVTPEVNNTVPKIDL